MTLDLPASQIGPNIGVQNRLKNSTFGGILDPQFDAVFNRIGCCAQSLYARARVGVTGLGQIQLKWTQSGPLDPPLIPQDMYTVYAAILWNDGSDGGSVCYLV